METTHPAPRLRWPARFVSLLAAAQSLLILVPAAINEDRPAPYAYPALALLVLAVLALPFVWRKERRGGQVLLVGSAALAVALGVSGLLAGLGPVGVLVALLCAIPWALTGWLFVRAARS